MPVRRSSFLLPLLCFLSNYNYSEVLTTARIITPAFIIMRFLCVMWSAAPCFSCVYLTVPGAGRVQQSGKAVPVLAQNCTSTNGFRCWNLQFESSISTIRTSNIFEDDAWTRQLKFSQSRKKWDKQCSLVKFVDNFKLPCREHWGTVFPGLSYCPSLKLKVCVTVR